MMSRSKADWLACDACGYDGAERRFTRWCRGDEVKVAICRACMELPFFGTPKKRPAVLRSDAPPFIRDGTFGRWWRWFAWRPVTTEQGRLVWLRATWRRRYEPPAWATVEAGWEYSDIRRSGWEVEGKGEA